MFPFLSLPYEIRHMVYHLALGVGVVHPYRQADRLETTHFTKTPNTNLLKTCRLIHTEALSIVYTHNTFFLPTTDLTVRFFTKALHNPTRQSWLKSVHLTLTHHDLPAFTHPRNNPEPTESFDTSSRRQICREDHEHASNISYLGQVSWPCKVRPLLDLLQLDTLILDLSEARYTNSSRHASWMIRDAMFAFQDGFAHGLPANLEVHGMAPCGAGGATLLQSSFLEMMVRMWTERRSKAFGPLG